MLRRFDGRRLAGRVNEARTERRGARMDDDLLQGLPNDLPSFLARFGSDAQCRDYLFRARWPAGFRCAGCGHERAYSHKLRLIEECAACGVSVRPTRP
jgi:hypothetical protein